MGNASTTVGDRSSFLGPDGIRNECGQGEERHKDGKCQGERIEDLPRSEEMTSDGVNISQGTEAGSSGRATKRRKLDEAYICKNCGRVNRRKKYLIVPQEVVRRISFRATHRKGF